MIAEIRRRAVLFGLFVVLLIWPGVVFGDDINIGVTLPQTGPAAYVGLDGLHGLQIAAKEINDAGGVMVAGKKYMVKIRAYDDEGNAAKAVAGMQLLKDKYNIPVVFQGLSGSLMGMLEKNEKLGIIITGFVRHPMFTKMGNKLVLRHHVSLEEDALFNANGAAKVLKAKRAALLSDVGDYGKMHVKIYKEAFAKMGVEIVAEEWLDMRTQTDFRGQLTKIKAANPDVIMLAALDEACAGAIKQAHELGIKTPFTLPTGFQKMGEKLTGPKLIEGYMKPMEYPDITPLPPAVERYQKVLYPAMGYKEPFSLYGSIAYQTTHTMVLAMQKAGTTTDAWKIRAAAPLVVPIDKKYDTTGFRAWKENGEGIMEQRLGVYRNGKLNEVKIPKD